VKSGSFGGITINTASVTDVFEIIAQQIYYLMLRKKSKKICKKFGSFCGITFVILVKLQIEFLLHSISADGPFQSNNQSINQINFDGCFISSYF